MVSCPACSYYFSTTELSGGVSRCPSCSRRLEAVIFPALSRADESVGRREEARDDDARCSYHAENQAQHVCGRCGRLICSVCAIPLGKQTVCPACLDRSLHAKKSTPFAKYVAWDSLALMLVVHPLLILVWWSTFFTASASLVISIIFFNKSIGPVRRGKWRFTLSIILSIAWISAWIIGIILFIDKVWPAMQESLKKGS
jgi:hypothetical protein